VVIARSRIGELDTQRRPPSAAPPPSQRMTGAGQSQAGRRDRPTGPPSAGSDHPGHVSPHEDDAAVPGYP
jgi:hypothetical protein